MDGRGEGVAGPYWPLARAEVARLLSWQDREPLSATYGCFDRTYWAWKFTDFPGARFQEGVYSLAHLYSLPAPGNNLAGDRRVLDWVRAGLRFWQRLQHPDGSFDEAYPHEHSLAATAFTGFYLGAAVARLNEALSLEERAGLRHTLARAGDWLCRNDERHGVLSNHLAAAAAALRVIYQLTGEDRFERRGRRFLQRIYDHQSPEGWYEEYGGADPGYQTHCTFYLAWLWRETGDPKLLTSLARSIDFLTHFIHPNGTLGGEYGSRNTEFYFPAGFELLASAVPAAARVARFLRPFVAEQSLVGLRAMDAYNWLPMLNNYLCAAEAAPELVEATSELPCQAEGEWDFPDAGLLVKSTPAYYAIIGLSKGGVLKLYDRASGRLARDDCGYWARLSDGRRISSQSLDRGAQSRRSGAEVVVEVDFVEVNQRLPSPWLFLGFRLSTLTLGRARPFAYWLKNRLVHALVRRRRVAPMRLTRRVSLAATTVGVIDELALTGPLPVAELHRAGKFATIHMGSARYFQRPELEPPPGEADNLAPGLRPNGRLRLDWAWSAVDVARAAPAGEAAEAKEAKGAGRP